MGCLLPPAIGLEERDGTWYDVPYDEAQDENA